MDQKTIDEIRKNLKLNEKIKSTEGRFQSFGYQLKPSYVNRNGKKRYF